MKYKIKYQEFSSFMYITYKKSKANLKLIFPPDLSTVYGELCRLSGQQNKETSGLKQRSIVWVLSVTGWLASNVAKVILIRHTN